MWYELLADVVVAAHFAYVSFVVLGLVAIVLGRVLGWQWIRNLWFRLVHLTMIVIVAVEATLNITCPLTTLETRLRQAAGQSTEGRSFVGRLLHALMFFDCPDSSWLWPVVYVGFATLVQLTFVLAPPRWKRLPQTQQPA